MPSLTTHTVGGGVAAFKHVSSPKVILSLFGFLLVGWPFLGWSEPLSAVDNANGCRHCLPSTRIDAAHSTASQPSTNPGLPVVSAEASTELPALEVTYDSRTDRLSLLARRVPLGRVLAEISTKARVIVSSSKAELLSEETSAELPSLPLEQALTKLLLSYNTVFLYSSEGETAPHARGHRLTKVTLLSKKGVRVPTTVAAPEAPAPRDLSRVEPSTPPDLPASLAKELVRAVLEKNSVVTNRIVAALQQPGKEAERENAAEGVIQTLLDRLDNNDVGPYSDLLAVLKALAPERAFRLLSDLLQGERKVVAAAGLGFMKDERGIPPLISALMGPDPTARHAAASNLVWIGGRSATEALFQAYLGGDNHIKRLVEMAILSHGDSGSREMLTNVITAGLAPGGPPLRDEWLEKRRNGDPTPQ